MKAALDISDALIAGHAQQITVRSYRPSLHTVLPIVLYFHGGRFVAGSLAQANQPASLFALKTPAWVIAVGYSLAPEFPFPIATEDAYIALQWAAAHAAGHGADANRIAAVGHDAGGNIVAALAAVARDRGGPKLTAQALLAPLLDPSMTRTLRGKSDLDFEECARSWRAYLPRAAERIHPYAAPLESRRLNTLPPAWIASVERDLVRADGEVYARELITAGVPVEMTRYCGVDHDGLVSSGQVLHDVASFLRRKLVTG
jgi:acetyl esterase